ncbi:MAG: hypothetical protein E7101_07230 [Prevotella ruminicola]|jgi:uncharacterized protein YjdB|uniref:BIG2 domain-containing protein n=1 Tax=Xylanibacter ruminicola TaxID=839 RepID=A0A9D5P0M9_XYLRU|nr:hypothetical protein [Xylanibacter ruminicola]
MTKKSISRLLQASLMCCLAVLFTACEDFGTEDNPTPSYISINTSNVQLKLGDTFVRKAIVAGSAVVTYSSSDETIATVDQEGKVTGIGVGTATITVEVTGYNAAGKKIYIPEEKSYKVTVYDPVNSLSSPALLTVAVGNSATITPTIDPAGYPIQWSSSDESIATVDETGKVTGVKVSTVPVTITAKAGGKTATCNVVVASFDLSTLTAAYTAQDGDVLTGVTTYPVSIPNGATIYLANATVNNTVECLGDATVAMVKETVSTISAATTAIKSGPAGTTLTLSGEGTLNATSSAYNCACIGSQQQGAAGNIVIEGGIINATAGDYAAAIGAGNGGTCQDITIQGGTVTAHAGSKGAGIGTGANGWGATACGNITITGGIVNAYGGYAGAGIGAGCANYYSSTITCSGITITGGIVNAYGGAAGAGIGTGVREYSGGPCPTCGNITISGGTITATRGGNAVWDIGPGVFSGDPGTYYGVVSGTISVTVTVKDKNGNDASIYAAP